MHSDKTDLNPVNFRIYALNQDGKTKSDHFQEMLNAVKHDKEITDQYVQMNSWYASVDNLKLINRMNMIFFTILKDNRLVSLTKEKGCIHVQDIH